MLNGIRYAFCQLVASKCFLELNHPKSAFVDLWYLDQEGKCFFVILVCLLHEVVDEIFDVLCFW